MKCNRNTTMDRQMDTLTDTTREFNVIDFDNIKKIDPSNNITSDIKNLSHVLRQERETGQQTSK